MAEQVLGAIRRNEFYVITHGEYASHMAAHSAALQGAFEAAPRRGEGGGAGDARES